MKTLTTSYHHYNFQADYFHKLYFLVGECLLRHWSFHPAASFIPPDVEEPPTPMELDDEELEWQQWLHDLMNPSGTLLIMVQDCELRYIHTIY